MFLFYVTNYACEREEKQGFSFSKSGSSLIIIQEVSPLAPTEVRKVRKVSSFLGGFN
jgi:hypothetical protein